MDKCMSREGRTEEWSRHKGSVNPGPKDLLRDLRMLIW